MWMSRPDIKQKHADGWQAVDATPQELSDNENQMGPASVHLISAQKNERCFDNQFVNSEVNAYTKLFLIGGKTKREALHGEHMVYLDQKGDKTYYEGLKFEEDAFDDEFNTIGMLVATKKPGAISKKCKDDGRKCQAEKHDVTWTTKKKKNHDSTGYKVKKSGGPGEPMSASEHDTSICMYGSKSDGTTDVMETETENLFRFKQGGKLSSLLRAQSMGSKRTREEMSETDTSDPLSSSEEAGAPKRYRRHVIGNSEGGGGGGGGGGVTISFDEQNRRPVTMGLNHVLSFKVTNNRATEIIISTGYSGVALDYRGIPLVRQTLRSGTKIPWRIIMKGRQTLWHTKTTVPPGAVEFAVEFIVPASSLSQIVCGKNHILRWTISTKVIGEEEASGEGGHPPPIHEFNALLVSNGSPSGCEQDDGEMEMDKMDVDEDE